MARQIYANMMIEISEKVLLYDIQKNYFNR